MAGPFNRYVQRPGFHLNRIWYTQKRPYVRRLRFAFDTGHITSDILSPPRSSLALQVMSSADEEVAISRCYDRFKSKCGESAAIAASIAEWRSTASSITQNAIQLAQLAIAVKRGDLKAANKVFRNKKKSVKADASSSVANRWLEFSFGWKPLIQDIYNAVSVLQNPFPKETIKARASYSRKEVIKPNRRETYIVTRQVSVQMIAEIRVTNPKLYVANQLGLINPVSVAWELVPFSFVVDWFTNLGQVLGTMSDFAGADLINPATTTKATTVTQYAYVENNGDVYDQYAGDRIEVNRQPSLVGPSLHVRPFNGFSVTRGANAIALLVQQLVR